MTTPTHVRVTGPGDLIASLPALLGFIPEESLTAVLLREQRVVCTVRVDLPNDLTTTAHTLLAVARNAHADAVVLVVHTDAPGLPRSDEVTALLDELHESVEVKDALLVRDGRWWSYLCADPSCCSGDGHRVPVGTTELEAERVRTGYLKVATSRQALAHTYRPRPDLAPSPEAVAAAEGVLALSSSDRAQAALDAVAALVRCPSQDLDELLRARLTLLVRDVHVRDAVICGLSGRDGDITAYVDAVARTALCTDPEHRPAVAAMAAALVHATAGDPVLLEQLLDLAEGESLAQLVRSAVSAAIPPQETRRVFAGATDQVTARLA